MPLSFFKSLSWPTYPVSRAVSFPGTWGIDRGHLAESTMAVGTGFGQLFRSVGQVRSVASAIEPLQTVTRSRSAVLPSRRRFSSRPSIENSRKGSRDLGPMRYLPGPSTAPAIYLPYRSSRRSGSRPNLLFHCRQIYRGLLVTHTT